MKTPPISFLFFCIYFSGLFFSNGFDTIAQTEKDSILFYYNLSINPKTSNDLVDSYVFFKIKKEESIKEKDTVNTVYYLRFIANIEFNLGAFYDSEASAVEALRLLKPKDRQEKIGLYNHLGIIHRGLSNYNDALIYYNKSLHLVREPIDSSTVFNNIGVVYKYQKKYNLAINAFKKAYEISWQIKDSLGATRALDNLGSSESKLNLNTALPNILKALSIRKELGKDKYTSYKHLSQYYLDRADTVNALKYAKKGYKIAKKINSPAYKEDALSNLVDLKANAYFYEYKILADSIVKAKQLQENKFASTKYNFHEQEKLTKESELKVEKEKSKRLVYQFIGLLLLISIIYLFFFLKSKFKKNLIENILKTEGRISKKVHDEVANDVYHVMTKLETNTNVKEDVLEYLEGIYNKTRDISKENSTINVNEDFDELLKDLLLSYKSKSINVITKNISSIRWKKVSDVKKTTIYRVLQELMTNMKKHSKASIVVLTFHQKRKLIINYSDNGIGSTTKKQNGLQNAENRIESASGTITFESQLEKGFKAKISI